MAKEKSPQREQIKVTDKRIFTPQGEIREEFRQQIKPSEPSFTRPAEAPSPPPTQEKTTPKTQPPREERRVRTEAPPPSGERRKTLADKAQNPGTAFTDFVEPLIAQAYISLGLLRNPYQQKPAVDVGAARQMIEILTMLKEKTTSNLTPDEEDFLTTHLGELKLAFVQRTKSL